MRHEVNTPRHVTLEAMAERTIVAVLDDVMFLSRLEQHVKALGYTFLAVESEVALRDALTGDVALVVVDLHVSGVEWRTAVLTAKEAGLPVLAFGRHTEPQLLREAREAGCDRVVARSQLVDELPALIEGLLPIGDPAERGA
jgi:DNA-binding response OmpR family regulator